ncbi:hypothetical protein J437_LFUL003041 [Ladona fulva]|uniref:Protein FAM177A1 n=1 Tax=Ladona fulva TaxID=123851 RepID=A0A8K0JVT3_LADFU|nr:hypothetical protein J437_LFUL003041 [Ladona fulva]
MDTIPKEETTSFSASEDNLEAGETPPHVASKGCDDVNLVSKSHRVLHFSDGTLDESELEEDQPDSKDNLEVHPKYLSWGPWMMYLTTTFGSKTLKAVDYVGESLANFFGITSPKYQYEIDEYEIMCSEEEEAKKRYDLEMGGWTANATEGSTTVAGNSVISEGNEKDVITDGTVKTQPHSLQS